MSPVNIGVILDDTHHRLGCCLVRDRQILVFPSAIPNGWTVKSMCLTVAHEMTHQTLADAGEDYRSETFARYAEKAIYGWLYGQSEYEVLLEQIRQHNQGALK